MFLIIALFCGGILALVVSDRTGIKILGLFLIAGAMVAFFLSDKEKPAMTIYFVPPNEDVVCIPMGKQKEKEILANLSHYFIPIRHTYS